MSWLKSAVHRAVEAGGNSNLTHSVRTYADSLATPIRSYADSVVNQAGQAVADGAKLLQDRIAAKNLPSFKHTVKRLEEVSVSSRGLERVQLLRKWLVALKEVERLSHGNDCAGRKSSELHISDESNASPKKPTLVLYYDLDIGGEPVDFRDVFLHSKAIEGMTLSIILEMPNEEETSLLLEIFGLCLTGGKEVHKAILSCIKDLSKAFSSYKEEVLVKREEFIQYAQSTIAGLKINAEISRIDYEASNIQNNLDGLKLLHERSSEKPAVLVEDPEQALERIRLCSRLESLLLKKKHLNIGDPHEVHAMTVEKLKVLSESLANSALKAENRISEHSSQKEEAMNFRKAKYKEVVQIEKALSAEIGELEKQKYKLEMELKKVNDSLAAACARLRNAREEKLQFDEASNQIVKHFETKANELSKSIDCYRAEADVCIAFIHFLEETWVFQVSYLEHEKKQVNDELGRYADYFLNFVASLLCAYKDDLVAYIAVIRKLVENLISCEGSELVTTADNNISHLIHSRRNLEEKYLEFEAKFVSTVHVVETIKKQFSNNKDIYRDDDDKVEKYFEDLAKINSEFESIERPWLEIESSLPKAELEKKMELEVTVNNTTTTTTDEPRLSGLSQLLGNESPTSKTIMSTSKENHQDVVESMSPTAELGSFDKVKINVSFQRADDTFFMQSQSPVGVLSPGSKLEVLEVIEKSMHENFATILGGPHEMMNHQHPLSHSFSPTEFSNNVNTNNTNNNNLVKEIDAPFHSPELRQNKWCQSEETSQPEGT